MSFSIRAEHVTKSYTLHDGVKHAVDNVSFAIDEGERVGIIGRNGAGKTTLLQMIAGIAAKSGGELRIAGHVTAIFTLGIGLRDDMTGRENILIDSELQGHTRAESEAFLPAVIAFAELGEFIDRPVRTYSTGMKARLAFSMIVHIDPEILIVDEALSVGDAAFSRKATAKMRELAARGRILIVVSHSMQSINDMCTRCIWMDNGKVRMDGAPDEVTRAYLDEVRQTDDAKLLERFKHEVSDESMMEGWRINELEFRGENGKALPVLQTGEPTQLRLAFDAPAGAGCNASVQFFRLDKVNICESRGPDLVAAASGHNGFALDLGALPLNYGFYALRANLYHKGAIAARRAICFEVINPNPHRGGRPVLVIPFDVSSEKIA